MYFQNRSLRQLILQIIFEVTKLFYYVNQDKSYIVPCIFAQSVISRLEIKTSFNFTKLTHMYSGLIYYHLKTNNNSEGTWSNCFCFNCR